MFPKIRDRMTKEITALAPSDDPAAEDGLNQIASVLVEGEAAAPGSISLDQAPILGEQLHAGRLQRAPLQHRRRGAAADERVQRERHFPFLIITVLRGSRGSENEINFSRVSFSNRF